MRIRLFDGPIKTSEAELSYIVDRVGAIVDRALGPAAEIEVRLCDINGPRGGVDKRCAILLSAPRTRSLRIEGRAANYYAAIDAAVAVLRRALARSLDRAHGRWSARRAARRTAE